MTDVSYAHSRRDEYAERTRADAIVAARRLFAERGYERTTVREIARRARVSPATIYAQCGGKEGLLESLMELWTTGDIIKRIIADCAAAAAGRDAIEILGRGYAEHYDESGDIALFVRAAGASVPTAREFLRRADERHFDALHEIIEGIRSKGDLRQELSVADAARIVFFHFRAEQYRLAVDDFGWGAERAREWITDRVMAAILRSPR